MRISDWSSDVCSSDLATIRLLDGSGQLVFDGETYTGRDPVFGSLAAVEAIEDGVGDEAPALNFTLLPASDAASAELASPDMQGSVVSLWLAAVDRATGEVMREQLMLLTGGQHGRAAGR